MVSTLKASMCLTIRVQAIMVREVLKLSFLLVLLIQFQTASYHFLHARDTTMISSLSILTKISPKGYLIREKMSQVAHYPHPGEGASVNKSWKKLTSFLTVKNRSHLTSEDQGKGWDEDDIDEDPEVSRDRTNLNLPDRLTNTIRSFYLADKENAVELDDIHFHMTFDITSIPINEKITRAELRVPFVILESTTNSTITVQVLVHDIVKIQWKMDGSETAQPISYPIDTKTLKFKTGENPNNLWHTFDVFPAVSRSNLKKHKKKRRLIDLGIEFLIRDKGRLSLKPEKVQHFVRVRRSLTNLTTKAIISTNGTSTILHASDTGVPILLTYSENGHSPKKQIKTLSRTYRSHQNQKRRRNHRIKNRRRNLCSRKKMFVDFIDVGWNDWIVAPPGYQAFFCSGSCPFPMAEHLNATNHAVIQALVNSMNPRLVPPPCCVPTKYSSLSLLYTDSSDRIVLKNYKEMIVESCGCS